MYIKLITIIVTPAHTYWIDVGVFNGQVPQSTEIERWKISKEEIEGEFGRNWELWAGLTRRTGDAIRNMEDKIEIIFDIISEILQNTGVPVSRN